MNPPAPGETTPGPADAGAEAAARRAAAFRPPPPRRGGALGHIVWAMLGAATAAVWGAAAWGRADMFAPGPVVALLTVLPWLALGLVVAAFTVWLVTPDHPAAAPLLALTTALGLGWFGPDWPAQPTEGVPGAVPVRVVTWNVRRLWGGEDDGGDPAGCVVSALRDADADVVVLQEVTEADVAVLAAALDLSCVRGSYHASGRAEAAGIAACARAPWALEGGPQDAGTDDDWQRLDLALTGPGTATLRAVHLAPYRLMAGGPPDDLGDARALFARILDVAHAQARQVSSLLDAPTQGATVLAGDFNASPDTPVHLALRRAFDDAWVRGARGRTTTVRIAERLPARIDYVYVSRDVGVRAARVPHVGCSDHKPAVADLLVPPAAP